MKIHTMTGTWKIEKLYDMDEVMYDAQDLTSGEANYLQRHKYSDYETYRRFIEQSSIKFYNEYEFEWFVSDLGKNTGFSFKGIFEREGTKGTFTYIEKNMERTRLNVHVKDDLLCYTALVLRYIFKKQLTQ